MNPMRVSHLTPGEAEELSSTWWIPLLSGIIAAIAGILILRIHWTVSGLAIFLGVLFIVNGLGDILSPTFTGGPRTSSAWPGVLEAGAGLALIDLAGPRPGRDRDLLRESGSGGRHDRDRGAIVDP